MLIDDLHSQGGVGVTAWTQCPDRPHQRGERLRSRRGDGRVATAGRGQLGQDVSGSITVNLLLSLL